MQVGKIVLGKVKSISKNYFWVDMENDYQGVVFIDEISDFYINDINKIIKIDDILKLEVLNYNEKNKKACLSLKRVKPKNMKNPFEFELKETPQGFKNLLKHAKKEVEDWKK